jgi:penicillin-binding protein 1A
LVKEQPKDWERPRGIVSVQVCRTSGLLPSPLCPPGDIVTDLFIRGTEPTQIDNVWTAARVVQQPAPHPDPKRAAKGETMDRWFLWRDGCDGQPVDRLFIRRPTTYVRHPTEPFLVKSNGVPKYLPKDWQMELPTEVCQMRPADNGGIITLPGGPPGTQPPGGGTATPPGLPVNPIIPPPPGQ